MSLKDKIQKIKDSWHEQKEQSKMILKQKWEVGAEEGRALKRKHQEKLKRKKNE